MTFRAQLTAFRYKAEYNSLLWLNKNNKRTQEYQEKGLNLLHQKVDNLPDKIAFRPKFLKESFCVKVEEINKEKVKNDVSKRAVENNEGLEFVAEVFKGLVKGEKYDNYIMGFYNRLKGPKVKQ